MTFVRFCDWGIEEKHMYEILLKPFFDFFLRQSEI